jgi:phage terminase small subunit
MSGHPLKNAKRERFCQEYLIDLNATAAAKRAGYSPKTAKSQASDLLTFPDVQARVAELKAERAERTQITADDVVMELRKLGFASMRRFISIDGEGQPQINLTDTPEDDLDALMEVQTETLVETRGKGESAEQDIIRKTKIKLHDKLGALRDLAEHTGVFDKANRTKADAVAQAFEQIWARGSKAPIRRDDPKADE